MENKKQKKEGKDTSNIKCPFCGTKMVLTGTFMLSDFMDIDFSRYDDSSIYDFFCPKCKTEMELAEYNECTEEL